MLYPLSYGGPGGRTLPAQRGGSVAVKSRRSLIGVRRIALFAVLSALVACAPAAPEPQPAVVRQTPPPWDAPRDAISYIEAAGLPVLDSGYRPQASRTAQLVVFVNGDRVTIPAQIGRDRVRALESALHTHSDDGTVWVEEVDADRIDDYRLADLFALWGVRFDAECLGSICGGVEVRVDGELLADPGNWVWQADANVQVDARG